MEYRPKIKLKPSGYDKIVEYTGFALFVLLWVITIINYVYLPDIIPTHKNFNGDIDSYGSKVSILLIPLITSVLYFGLSLLGKYPHIFNYPVEITEDNCLRQYTKATRLLRTMKVMIVSPRRKLK